MRKVLILMSALTLLGGGDAHANPLLEPWDAPFGVPPFAAVAVTDFEPAFAAAIAEHEAEIAAITAEAEPPTFANTIEALDASGRVLARVSSVFYALNGTMTNPEMQQVAKTMAPVLSRHRDAITLDADLFRLQLEIELLADVHHRLVNVIFRLVPGRPGSWNERRADTGNSIVQYKGRWYLYHSGEDARRVGRIGLHVAGDRIAGPWRALRDRPILGPGPAGSWDSVSVAQVTSSL